MGIYLIHIPDREHRTAAIRAFLDVRQNYVRLPGQRFGISEEHRQALDDANIPYINLSKSSTSNENAQTTD